MNVAAAIAAEPEAGVYLRSALAPLQDALARPEVTDIYINRPRELWIESVGGGIERNDDPALDEVTLMRLARQVAALSHQGISREHPLLSAVLPDGSRVQVVAPPATRGPLALAIRKQVAPKLALADYAATGAFTGTSSSILHDSAALPTEVVKLVQDGDLATALAEAVRTRLNILVSGGTSTGKTTFLNALLREVPSEERLILIEDTPELHVEHENCVGLIAVRGNLGEAQVCANDLVSASLRMRPDRIILGELRGVEALAFLRAINSGHPGSMTTIHADSPEAAVEQLVLLALEAGTALTRDDVRHYVTQTIDVFVQLGRNGGKRSIKRVALRSS
jgi:type IV secretion system protein VirB11